MPDVASIAAALGSVKTGIELAKLLRDSDTALKTAELKLQLASVLSALVEAKSGLLDAQEEIRQRDREIAELRHSLEDQSSVRRVHDGYYRVGENGKPVGPAHCSRCYETDKVLRTLTLLDAGHTQCTTCQALYVESRTGTYQ